MKQVLKNFRDRSPVFAGLCRVLRATGLVTPKIWKHLPFTGVIDFDVGRQKVRMHHFAAEIENSLFWAGYGKDWEATTLCVWRELARDSMSIYDVGANTGLFALAAKAINPKAAVDAFEPLPAIVDRLRANVLLNGMEIEVHAVAVSDQGGTAPIKIMDSAHEYSASFEHMEWMNTADYVTIEVPLVTLSGVASKKGRSPDLIKLDVERHEPQALRGLWNAVDGGQLPTMIVEILDNETAALVADEICVRGYRTFVIREKQGLTEAPLHFEPGTINWLFIPPGAGGLAAEILAQGSMTHSQLGSRP